MLSGNRNFEGRVHPDTAANYLASPPLVVAFALAGTVDIDFATEPLGVSAATGAPVFLRDVWPDRAELQAVVAAHVSRAAFDRVYAGGGPQSAIWRGNDTWKALIAQSSPTPSDAAAAADAASAPPARFRWSAASTYIQPPPFFAPSLSQSAAAAAANGLSGARCLLLLGDSVTTDHISPAGSIATGSDAGAFLRARGVQVADFNSYGARRGNDHVMVRGTFANARLGNRLVGPGQTGPRTLHLPSSEVTSVFDASQRYQAAGVPLIILAGKEYGTGSSRDWAAKGPALLGVRAVIAESYERIHRSNLVGMGVLPLQFAEGESAASLGLTGKEVFAIRALLPDSVQAAGAAGGLVEVTTDTGVTFRATKRVDTAAEASYMSAGGILPFVVDQLMQRTPSLRMAGKL